MPGRRPHEAARAFLEPLNKAASCITQTPFITSPHGYDLGEGHGLRLGSEEFVTLKAGPLRFNFSAAIDYAIVENERSTRAADRYRVTTRGYKYHLLTEDFTEILLWHWHPNGNSAYKRPHWHVGTKQLGPSAVLETFQHVPSGRIAFEDVLLHLIESSRIDTLCSRDEAVETLMGSLQLFHQYRTWHA